MTVAPVATASSVGEHATQCAVTPIVPKWPQAFFHEDLSRFQHAISLLPAATTLFPSGENVTASVRLLPLPLPESFRITPDFFDAMSHSWIPLVQSPAASKSPLELIATELTQS